ncbi:L,D-transpeptidase [Microcoleus sp. herbarium2]|uniref:L,D-transpeptidase n=1 Tax=Microcoleus sp. herbarium2 TaxID=3055433 RepID=UPI002FD513C5
MPKHKLIFTMPLAISQELILGSLELIYPDGQVIDYLATSGLPDYQRPTDEWVRGKGPIPAGEYEIPTKPYWLDTRGVEGYFFHITPDPVGSGDRIRSELGIHWDANVPGTSGCIGLINPEGWDGFCRRMAKIASLGVKSLSLKVEY